MTSGSGRFSASWSTSSSGTDIQPLNIMHGEGMVGGNGSDVNGVKLKHKLRRQATDLSCPFPHQHPLHSLPLLRRATSSYFLSSKVRSAIASGSPSASSSTTTSGSPPHLSDPSSSSSASSSPDQLDSSTMTIPEPGHKVKSSFIGVKWFGKRQRRDRQLSESKSMPSEKLPLPHTPPSDSELQGDMEKGHCDGHRISVILDDLPLSLSDLGSDSELDSLSSPHTSPPTTPPPTQLHSLPILPTQRKNKLQTLLISNPYDETPRSSSPPSSRRPLLPNLNLNLPIGMGRRRSRTLRAAQANNSVYNEKDGWCIDDHYDGGERVTPVTPLTPLSDIVFGERPPSPKPRKEQRDEEADDAEEEDDYDVWSLEGQEDVGVDEMSLKGFDDADAEVKVGHLKDATLASSSKAGSLSDALSGMTPTQTSLSNHPDESQPDLHHHPNLNLDDFDDETVFEQAGFTRVEHMPCLLEYEYAPPFDHYRDPLQPAGPNLLHHPSSPQNNPCHYSRPNSPHPKSHSHGHERFGGESDEHGEIYCRATSPSLLPPPIRITDREYEPGSTSGTLEESYSWVGYWNRGSFQEVVDELRTLKRY
ncbi:hypothetical protein AAF712_010999 [Marasmius tenuissimus]|uniref:Uncharacterized protein n=1 Tax=Marasmius tenuissimus TaxID=585030 RepID=A0ABR2ZP46_9AGAR